MRSQEAQHSLLEAFKHHQQSSVEELLNELLSDASLIEQLWAHHTAGSLPGGQLSVLFDTFELERAGKAAKPQLVCDVLAAIGADQVLRFWKLEQAVGQVKAADVVFIDFYLNDNERDAEALERIDKHKEALSGAKLLFVMSSRASLATQQAVRERLGIRNAFFEVMAKQHVDETSLRTLIENRRRAYEGNRALANVLDSLVRATSAAAEEFDRQCKELEVHDLQLLDVSRLATEGESISSYLTWLASESIAAKIRRLCREMGRGPDIDTTALSVTGQLEQSKILFNLFSEVVFGPGGRDDEGVRFGEVLAPKPLRRSLSRQRKGPLPERRSRALLLAQRSKASHNPRPAIRGKERSSDANPYGYRRHAGLEDNRYLLVLTPACDLVRCEPSRTVLCVEGTAQSFKDIRSQVAEKMYGKHGSGVRHLIKVPGSNSPLLITWHKDRTFMFRVRDLGPEAFHRVAVMNEIYAQEVKEEVLREMGRVGTQIDPPPAFALHAILKWRLGKIVHDLDSINEPFYAAILTYSVQRNAKGKPEESPSLVLSEGFQKWAEKQIVASANGQPLHAKLEGALTTIKSGNHFSLKRSLEFPGNGFMLRVAHAAPTSMEQNLLLDITFVIKG
nr:hypothetical protein [uncultured Caldimonas sp.]